MRVNLYDPGLNAAPLIVDAAKYDNQFIVHLSHKEDGVPVAELFIDYFQDKVTVCINHLHPHATVDEDYHFEEEPCSVIVLTEKWTDYKVIDA
jgi:hypothetical protein